MESQVLSLLVILLSLVVCSVVCNRDEDAKYRPNRRMERPPDDGEWKKKNILDMHDGDIEKIYDQWEEGEEELPVDELPPWEQEPPPIDMRKVNVKDKDSILREGKRYRNLMMFATVAGNPTRAQTEKISSRWESSLFNANVQMKRYVIEDDKILIQLDDGSNAVEIRDFITSQEDCWDVTVESKTYDGKGKLAAEKQRPMTKEEAAAKKKAEAERKAEILRAREEREKKKKEQEEKKKNKKAKKGKNKKKDEL